MPCISKSKTDSRARPYISKSKTDSHATPDNVLQHVARVYGQVLPFDPCPLNDNPEFDGRELSFPHGGVVFVNPPYSQLKTTRVRGLGWVEKCHQEAQKGAHVVMLLPARTDTQWFHDIILENKYRLEFWRGRLKFKGSTNSAPFPSMLVIMKPNN